MSPFAPAVRVAIQDANGQTITTADTDIVISLVAQPNIPVGQPAGAPGPVLPLLGTRQVRSVQGVATFDNLRLAFPGDGYRIQASVGTLASSPSAPFSVRLTFTTVSAGDFHTCGLTIAPFVYCWGLNGLYQLGDSTNIAHYLPWPVKGLATFEELSAGGSHGCAIATGASVYCWGGLPPGSSPPPPLMTPTPMAGLNSIAHVSAGHVAQFSNSCAVTSGGVAYCWGNYNAPAAVTGAPQLRTISTGGGHACGLTADSLAYCWGANYRGQLGDSSTNDSPAAVAVAGGLRFIQVAAGGEHTCGIAADSVAYCWGGNGVGALGDSTTDQRLVPTRVWGTFKFIQLSGGGAFTCGVTTTHAAFCWGNNGSAQLGDGSSFTRLIPTPVSGGLVFSEVSAGTFHSCGRASDGAYCWGFGGGGGLLGDGSSGSSLVPRRVLQ